MKTTVLSEKKPVPLIIKIELPDPYCDKSCREKIKIIETAMRNIKKLKNQKIQISITTRPSNSLEILCDFYFPVNNEGDLFSDPQLQRDIVKKTRKTLKNIFPKREILCKKERNNYSYVD